MKIFDIDKKKLLIDVGRGKIENNWTICVERNREKEEVSKSFFLLLKNFAYFKKYTSVYYHKNLKTIKNIRKSATFLKKNTLLFKRISIKPPII